MIVFRENDGLYEDYKKSRILNFWYGSMRKASLRIFYHAEYPAFHIIYNDNLAGN
jgi:hypothetical protein